MFKKQETVGVFYDLLSAALWGIYPVVINYSTKNLPPIAFGGIVTLVSGFGFFIYVLFLGKLSELKNKKSYYYLFLITLFMVAPQILFFAGAKMTSGLNTSALLLAEIIFTLIFTHFIGEKTTFLKLLGALGIFLGSLFILFNGVWQFNFGDLLIVLSTATYPVGNFYTKKALYFISPATILFFRSFAGGLLILILAYLFEADVHLATLFYNNWEMIFFIALVPLIISKIAWFEALKRLDISKAVSLVMTFPLFSLLILIVIFKETLSVYQWLGMAMMMIGVYFSVKRISVDPEKTKYKAISE